MLEPLSIAAPSHRASAVSQRFIERLVGYDFAPLRVKVSLPLPHMDFWSGQLAVMHRVGVTGTAGKVAG